MRWREGRLASLPGFAEAPSEAEGEVEGSRRAGKPGSPPVSLDRQPSRGARFSDIFGRRILINSAEVCILRTSLVIVSFSLALFVPLFAHAAGQTLEARRAELNRLLADEWEYTLRTQPELATQVGDDRYNDRLSDFSDKAIADDLEHSRQSLARFEAIDVTGFPEQEKLNHSLMLRSSKTGRCPRRSLAAFTSDTLRWPSIPPSAT